MRTPCIHIAIVMAFLANLFGPLPMAQAQEFHLPTPGVMVHLSPPLDPPMLKGIKVHPDNPFRFDFILDKGDSSVIASAAKQSQQEQLKTEATRLIKYFLASLTIPEKDLWVNLSPYEKDRIIPQSFGLTEMGRDLLAEDYMLKQITASLIYPEDAIGKKFWKRIYDEAAKKYGTTNIPVNTFNKVWIVPDKAVVYENVKAGTAYVVESKLKVMLEQDYLALNKNMSLRGSEATEVISKRTTNTNALGSQIVREIVIPELTKEVNNDKNFAHLRQVYNSLILATWYKKKIKDSILAQVYADKSKIAGVQYTSTVIPARATAMAQTGIQKRDDVELIYQRYLKAFKKGVYNYIKEDIDPATQEAIPRKYFSGGVNWAMIGQTSLRLKAGSGIKVIEDSRKLPNDSSDAALVVESDLTPSAATVIKLTNNRNGPTFVGFHGFQIQGLSNSDQLNLRVLQNLMERNSKLGQMIDFRINRLSDSFVLLPMIQVINNSQPIYLDISDFNGTDKISYRENIKKIMEFAQTVSLAALGSSINRKWLINLSVSDKIKFQKDLQYALYEMIFNAWRHGNKLNNKLPIFIYFNLEDRSISILNIASDAILDPHQDAQAHAARLWGEVGAVNAIQGDPWWNYSGEFKKDSTGNDSYYEAKLKMKDFADLAMISRAIDGLLVNVAKHGGKALIDYEAIEDKTGDIGASTVLGKVWDRLKSKFKKYLKSEEVTEKDLIVKHLKKLGMKEGEGFVEITDENKLKEILSDEWQAEHGQKTRVYLVKESLSLDTETARGLSNIIGVSSSGDISTIRKLAIAQDESFNDIDELTKLPRRASLEKKFIELMKKRAAHKVVVFIDLDHFKDVNDRHGHLGGDLTLQATAQVILEDLRITEGDGLFRLGGEEFVILMPFEGNEKELEERLEGIRSKVEEQVYSKVPALRKANHVVTPSMGVSFIDFQVEGRQGKMKNLDQMIINQWENVYTITDAQLYKSKHEGRNRFNITKVQIQLGEPEELIKKEQSIVKEDAHKILSGQYNQTTALVKVSGQGKVVERNVIKGVMDPEGNIVGFGKDIREENKNALAKGRLFGFSLLQVVRFLKDTRSGEFILFPSREDPIPPKVAAERLHLAVREANRISAVNNALHVFSQDEARFIKAYYGASLESENERKAVMDTLQSSNERPELTPEMVIQYYEKRAEFEQANKTKGLLLNDLTYSKALSYLFSNFRITDYDGAINSLKRPEAIKAFHVIRGDAALISNPIEKIKNNVRHHVGGIDLTPSKMNLQIKMDSRLRGNDGFDQGIRFHIDPAMLQRFQNAPGFTPVIINIRPMTSLRRFLGVNDQESIPV